MATKEKPTNVNTNNNVNNNNVNVKVHVERPKRIPKKKKANWYLRTLIGAVITFFVAFCLYKLQDNNDVSSSMTIEPNSQPIEGTKQN